MPKDYVDFGRRRDTEERVRCGRAQRESESPKPAGESALAKVMNINTRLFFSFFLYCIYTNINGYIFQSQRTWLYNSSVVLPLFTRRFIIDMLMRPKNRPIHTNFCIIYIIYGRETAKLLYSLLYIILFLFCCWNKLNKLLFFFCLNILYYIYYWIGKITIRERER